MEETYYTEQELQAMSIFRLRECARNVGVPSPTSKRKQELIDLYLEIAAGKKEPVRNTTKRGRPPKNDSGIAPVKLIGDASAPVVLQDSGTVRLDRDAYARGYKPAAQESAQPDQPARTQERVVPQQEQRSYPRNNNNNRQQYSRPDREGDQNAVGGSGAPQREQREWNFDEMLSSGECERKSGLLDIHTDGYGFLRAENCEYGTRDTYISAKMIKGVGLRAGDMVQVIARKNSENKPPAAMSVETVNGMPPENLRRRPVFDNLTPIYPNERIRLEVPNTRSDFAIRCIDLVAPIGKGQRAMIVSPPKAGKTTLLKKIASSIEQNYPQIELFVLLVDERPEEVTDMQRSIKGEVIYSTFDEAPEHHCKAAELLIERAKRSVELGKDVVIIMDSLTRLARAYNLTIPPTGRTLSGGMDPGALHNPKRFFGSARKIENGGSLTIIATALIDTGSRMDDVIYEEFKGTGNMEIHLDRKLSERRIFPAIDLNRSGTRREDLLLSQKELEGVFAMRRMLSIGDGQEMTEQLLNMMVRTKNNTEFVDNLCMQYKAFEKEGYKLRN